MRVRINKPRVFFSGGSLKIWISVSGPYDPIFSFSNRNSLLGEIGIFWIMESLLCTNEMFLTGKISRNVPVLVFPKSEVWNEIVMSILELRSQYRHVTVEIYKAKSRCHQHEAKSLRLADALREMDSQPVIRAQGIWIRDVRAISRLQERPRMSLWVRRTIHVDLDLLLVVVIGELNQICWSYSYEMTIL